jgi:topoisomerase-4 subunit A
MGEFRGEDRLLIITQKGVVKTEVPDMALHFDADMLVLEKWNPKKPVSVIYYEGAKERYYIKRFLIENPQREESFITDHAKTFLELVSTDWRPVAEISFVKPRGKDAKPNQEIDMEQFISIKGIKALGNQLTADKVKNIDFKDALPYEEPQPETVEEIEVVDEQKVGENDEGKPEPPTEEDGQGTLFD